MFFFFSIKVAVITTKSPIWISGRSMFTFSTFKAVLFEDGPSKLIMELSFILYVCISHL